MNALYVIGFLCLVELSTSWNSDGSHQPGAYGKFDGHGFLNYDFEKCFDFVKYKEEAAQTPGCTNVTEEYKAPPVGPGGEHLSHHEHDNGEGHKADKGHGGSHDQGGQGHKHVDGHHHGHGHGHGGNFGRLVFLTNCFNTRFEVENKNNETVVANVIKAIETVALPEKSPILSEKFNKCANMATTLTRQESKRAMECYGKILMEECPKSAGMESTTQATA